MNFENRFLKSFAAGAADDPALAEAAVLLEQERVTGIADFGQACAFFFQDEPPMDQKMVDKWKGQEHIAGMLDSFIASITEMTETSEEGLEKMIRDWAEANGFEKIGPIVHPTRLAVTGKKVGPGLWQLMAALGKDRLIQRLTRAKGILA